MNLNITSKLKLIKIRMKIKSMRNLYWNLRNQSLQEINNKMLKHLLLKKHGLVSSSLKTSFNEKN